MGKFLLVFIHLIAFHSFGQDWLFGTSSNFTNEAMDVKIDALGNSIATGYLSGNTNFKDTFLSSTNGNSDIFLTKFDPEGVIIWTKKFGGTQADRGVKVAIDNQDNILMTGSFFGSVNFGSINLQSANNSKDIFLVKFDPDGNVIWARKEGGNYGENAYDVITDNQNNVILTGQFEGISSIANASFISQINPYTNGFSFDLFISKYTSAGIPIWSKKASSEYEDRGMAVICDPQNNIYLTGQFSDTIDFLGTTFDNQIYNAAFVSKISPNGDMIYFKKFAGAMALPYDISLNDAKEIYITGDFLGNLIYFDDELLTQVTNPYTRRIFILKLSNNGNLIWGKAQGSNSELSSRSLTIDSNQDVYIGGYFSCNFDQYRDSSNTTGLWNSVGFKDVFVSKFSPSGHMLWNKQNGGRKDDLCYAVAIKETNRPVYAGSYENNFIVPSLSPNLFHFDSIGVPQYVNTWPVTPGTQADGNPNPNFLYYLLVGDDTKNAFVGKVNKQNTPPFYFYRGSAQTHPFVSPDLEPAVSVYNTCLEDSIYFNSFVDPEVGPGYTVSWNGNQAPTDDHYYNLTQNETVILNTSRWDNCSTFKDTITISLHDQFPVKLTDDHGFNNLKLPHYDTIFLCYPDSALVTPTNLCANCDFLVSDRATDTLVVFHRGMTPFYVFQGYYYMFVYNEFGCLRVDTLVVVRIQNAPYHLIVPDLVLYDTIDFNDSIQVCQRDTAYVVATDLLTNPLNSFDSVYIDVMLFEGFSVLNHDQILMQWLRKGKYFTPHWVGFVPDSTGWYVFQYDYGLGYNNRCGSDYFIPPPYIDSFYIEVLPLPDATVVLTQDGPICPGELNTIKVVPDIYNFEWEGPGITWQSDDGDSIQVTTAGDYLYNGYIINPENGCKVFKEFTINVIEKSPPTLFRNPDDGVVCPNQHVDIWIEEEGLYEWYGVNGTVIDHDSIIQVENQGFYYCLFTDVEGCEMVTQQVEVREFTSPSLYVYPDDVMCENETVFLYAIYYGESDVFWQSPINSSSATISVTQPGVYRCEVSQCGITVLDSVTIIDGSFDINLSASQTDLCYGDTAVITANPDLGLYFWNDLFYEDEEIEVTIAGDYYLTATNNLGCSQVSQVITINQFPESVLPPIPDTNVCPGATITVTHNSPFNMTWYEDPLGQVPIVAGPTITFTNVMQDTFVYAAYASANCPIAVGNMMVNVIEPLLPPLLVGDNSICIGDSLYFETPPNDSLIYEWYLNGNLISNEFSTFNPDSAAIFLDSNARISLRVTDFCSTNMDSTDIIIIQKKSMSLNLDNELLCPQNPLTLYSDPTFPGTILWVNGPESSISDSLLIYLNQLNDNYIVGYGIDSYGCYSTPDTVSFIIPDLTYLNISRIGFDCINNQILLIANSDVNHLIWTHPDQNISLNDSIAIDSMNQGFVGLYKVQAIDDQFGCVMNDSISLSNHPLPEFNIGEDTALCYFYAPLNYSAPNLPYTFYWNDVQSNTYQVDVTEDVVVRAVSEFGCEYTDSFHVYFSDCNPAGPNIITPNGDGINDYLIIKDAELLFQNCLIVLNRWGNVVYEDDYYDNSFHGYTNEGERLHDGVYFYLFYSVCKDKHSIVYQGYLQILWADY